MNNKTAGCVCVVLGALLAFSLLLNLGMVAGRMKDSVAAAAAPIKGPADPIEPLKERTLRTGKGEKKVIHLALSGPISSSISGRIGASMVDDLLIQLRQAAADDHIAAIVLAIDSPGGEVTASDILYRAVAEAREKKPVVISMGSMAASGGYYAAMGGSWILAHETTFTGSIGVIIQTFEYRALLDKVGVAPRTFKSGAFKDMLSGTRPMTPEEDAYVQQLIMQTYDIFVGIVARERKLPEPELRSGPADGRILTGKDALAAKLIDQLGGIDAAYAKARELASVPDAPVVEYQERMTLGRLFRFLGSESRASVEVKLPLAPVMSLESGRAYLLPSICVP